MKRCYFICVLSIALAQLPSFNVVGQGEVASKQAHKASLPENPCEVVSAEQVSTATGLEVASVERVPSIAKIVEAQRTNQEPAPGRLCTYETHSAFGMIMIAVPSRADRRAAEYWKARAKYFETYPGSGQFIRDLGSDAWLAGGSTLHVLISGDEYFSVSTQMYQPGSRDLLVKIARVVLSKIQ